MALIATFRWPTRSGAASAAPSAALSGSQPKAPGFAGRYLLSIVLVAFMALVSGLLDRAIQHALVEMSIDTPSSGSNGRDIDR